MTAPMSLHRFSSLFGPQTWFYCWKWRLLILCSTRSSKTKLSMHFLERERFFSIYVHSISGCFSKSLKKDAIFKVSFSERVFNSEFARCLMVTFSNIMRKACKKLWIRLSNLMAMVLSRTNEQRIVSACLAVTTHTFKFSSLKTNTRNKFQARSKIFL